MRKDDAKSVPKKRKRVASASRTDAVLRGKRPYNNPTLRAPSRDARSLNTASKKRSSPSLARLTYLPEMVSTRIFSPIWMKRGTVTTAPVSRVAGLSPPDAVLPLIPGSVSPEGDAPVLAEADTDFRTIIDSFRPLTAREKVTGTSHTLHYIQVPRGATFASLASSVKLPDAENQLRLINGYYPSGEPRTGNWIKVIR